MRSQRKATTTRDTLKKTCQCVCSFPHRQWEAKGKPETRDETCWSSRKKSTSYETSSSNFDTVTPSKPKVLQLPPYTRRSQRLEMTHVDASNRAFRARLPLILTLGRWKIGLFLRVFKRTSKIAISKSMFRARLPPNFITSHKMPRLPRNLHFGTTSRSPANAIRTISATRHV